MSAAHALLAIVAAFAAQTPPTATDSDSTTTSTHALSRLSRALGHEPFSLEAERIHGIRETGVYVAEGDVLMIRGDVIVRADRITFDRSAEKAIAEGHVTVIEPTSILTCKRVEMRLPELFGGLEDIELRIKSPIPEEIRRTRPAEELRHYGKSELIVNADRLERLGKRTLEISGRPWARNPPSGVFTICDCGDDAPTWSMRASHASVDLDSGAWLTAPVLYAKEIPILVLPAFYVPLGSRRSGLLVPRLRHLFNPYTGFHVAQPIFLALGESWDATFEPGFMRNRGASLGTEVRWAPTEESRGQAHLFTIFDMGKYDGTPVSLGSKLEVVRYALSLRHDTRFDSARLVADVNAVGDPYSPSEFATTFLTRNLEYTMSRVTLNSTARAEQSTRAAGGLLLVQDTRLFRYRNDMGPLGPNDLRHTSLFSAGQNSAGAVRYRFAELRLDAFPYPLFDADSPLLGSARFELDAHAAPRSDTARFVRADFRPAVSMPISLAGLAVFEPALAGRFGGWAGRADRDSASASRIGVIGRASLFTELGRRYSDWFHRVRPELRYLVIPVVERSGTSAFETADDIDLLARAQQVSARLLTDLFDAPTGRRIAGLEGWISRDLDMPGRSEPGKGTSEVVVRGDVEITPADTAITVRLDGRAGIDPHDAVLTELIAGFTFLWNVHSLFVQYGRFSDRMPLYTLIAPEEIAPSSTIRADRYIPLADFNTLANAPNKNPVDVLPWSGFEGVIISTTTKPVQSLTLSVGFSLAPDPNLPLLRSTSSLIRWDSECDCFGVGLVANSYRTPPGAAGTRILGQSPNVELVLSLGRFGEVRSSQQ